MQRSETENPVGAGPPDGGPPRVEVGAQAEVHCGSDGVRAAVEGLEVRVYAVASVCRSPMLSPAFRWPRTMAGWFTYKLGLTGEDLS